VLSGRARYRGRSTFKTWLFGVIRLVAHEHHRRGRARQERTLAFVPDEMRDMTNPDPQEEVEIQERKQALLASLRTLSDRQREALHLVFYQDLTIEEAAEVMGVSLGSARTHYQRGKERLRALLLQDGSR